MGQKQSIPHKHMDEMEKTLQQEKIEYPGILGYEKYKVRMEFVTRDGTKYEIYLNPHETYKFSSYCPPEPDCKNFLRSNFGYFHRYDEIKEINGEPACIEYISLILKYSPSNISYIKQKVGTDLGNMQAFLNCTEINSLVKVLKEKSEKLIYFNPLKLKIESLYTEHKFLSLYFREECEGKISKTFSDHSSFAEYILQKFEEFKARSGVFSSKTNTKIEGES